MERRPFGRPEDLLVQAARSLEHNRQLRVQATERESRAVALLLDFLEASGQSCAVLGHFEISRIDDELVIRRQTAAQLSLPQFDNTWRTGDSQSRSIIAHGQPPAELLDSGEAYQVPSSPLPRQMRFLAPDDARLLHFLEDLLQHARRLAPDSYPAMESNRTRIQRPEDVATLLSARMVDLPQEQLRLLTLSTRNDLLREHLVYQGTLSTSPVRPADIFRLGVADNAAALIIVHNHPSGDPAPSSSDVQLTRKLVDLGREMDMPLQDHIILAHQGWVSLRERGMGF